MSNHSKLIVVRRSIGDLKPYAGNARRHSRKQLRKIAESLQRFGWTNPILIDENGMVLAGHGRLEAARMLGWDMVETICRLDSASRRSAPTSLLTTALPRKQGGTESCWRSSSALSSKTVLRLRPAGSTPSKSTGF